MGRRAHGTRRPQPAGLEPEDAHARHGRQAHHPSAAGRQQRRPVRGADASRWNPARQSRPHPIAGRRPAPSRSSPCRGNLRTATTAAWTMPSRKDLHMRRIALIFALFAISGPAAAQSWTEYSYPDDAFRVSFPAEPKIETTTYQAADGHAVPARVYSVAQDNAEFRMTIADLSDDGLAESAVIDQAIATLSKGGEVKVNIPARVSRVFGRQLSIQGTDGSRTSVALFDYKGRLYQIEGKSLPNRNATADAIRFQQSLIFTDNGTNAAPGERGPRGD